MADIKKELKRDSHSVWSRIKRKTGSTILSVMSLINTPMIANATTQIIPNEEDNSPKIENTHIRTYDVGYQIDTISTSNGAGGSFSVDRNAITLYYNEEDPIKDAKRRHVIAHEKKHQIDNQNNPATLNMSLEEYYKIKHHQEIGATTVGLLQSIYDLETATSEDEAQKIIEQTPDFSEYLKSIHNGEHTIFKCSNPEQFDRELNYMANHVRNQWTDKYVETYESSMLNFIEGYFVSHHYKDIQPNPKVYQKEVSRIYTIGGIDFSKYFEKDITCYNEAVKQADELIMQDAKRSKIISLIKNAENYYINDQNSNKQQSLLPPISFEQLGKLHYDQQKREFINELLSIRQQWLNANPEERGNITSSNQDIQNYLQGLQQGTILPQFTGLSNSEITFINSVEYQKNNLTKQ